MTLDTNKCTIKKMQLLPISSTFFHFDERSVQKVYKNLHVLKGMRFIFVDVFFKI